ncbi:hypothetical protein Plhal304r1_c023g0079441 [Plasmopara halstedii]
MRRCKHPRHMSLQIVECYERLLLKSYVSLSPVISELEDRKHNTLLFRPNINNVIATSKSLFHTE